MIIKTMARIGLAASLALATSGAALADTVTIDGSGSDSSATVTIDTTTSYDSTTTNDLQILNVNEQVASTGDATATDNTTVGPVGSGSSSNSNTTATMLAINNTSNGGGGGGSGGDNGGGGSGGGSGGTNGGSGGASGSVEGASTTGGTGGAEATTLPEVGAKNFVDVSALRALYHPASLQTPVAQLAHRPEGVTLTFLLAIALVSLIGAYGTAAYAEWRARRRGI